MEHWTKARIYPFTRIPSGWLQSDTTSKQCSAERGLSQASVRSYGDLESGSLVNWQTPVAIVPCFAWGSCTRDGVH